MFILVRCRFNLRKNKNYTYNIIGNQKHFNFFQENIFETFPYKSSYFKYNYRQKKNPSQL